MIFIWSQVITTIHNCSLTGSAAGVLGACCCPVLAPAEVLRDPAPLDPLVVAGVPALVVHEVFGPALARPRDLLRLDDLRLVDGVKLVKYL